MVEDNPITRKSVRLALEVEGYRVSEAASGEAALTSMRRVAADLVLLDLLLPDTHGADLIVELRALPGGSDIPILAFSGFISRMEEARVAAAGFTDFILKPIEPSRLVVLVANYLTPRTDMSPAAAGRRLLLVDDDPVQLKLSRLQFAHAGFTVQVARDGSDALAQARLDRPDLIVTDVLMPNMDGFELCLAVRYDAVLHAVPLMMISANYLEDADQELGKQVGANAFVYRDQGFPFILKTALEILADPSPSPTIQPEDFDVGRYTQVVRQLERQVKLQAACAQRTVVQSAILHEMGLISETLARRKDLESALDEILAYCLDGAGLSKGALYLTEEDGPLILRAQFGCTDALENARAFFGMPEVFERSLRSGETIILPSSEIPLNRANQLLSQANAKSALLLPVRFGERDFAALLLLSLHRDLLEEDWLAYGRALAAQIGQSIALSRAFYRLSESELRYRSLYETANDGICITDDEGRILDANPAARKLFGYPIELLRGIHLGHILAGPDRERWPVALTEYQRSGTLQGEFTYLTPTGFLKTIEVRGTRARAGAYLNIVLDISERRLAEQTIHHLAYRDTLTDLPNRAALHDRLKLVLRDAHTNRQTLALLILNLNNFREVNDTLGHRNGDEVLKHAGGRLKDILWESDMVARLAADEFAVLLPRLARERDIDVVARKIIEGFKAPFMVADIPIDVQPSFGIALFPEHGVDADILFQHADVALYAAKAHYQPYVIYDIDIDHHDPQQLSLMAELRSAIAAGALLLHYQPKVDLRTHAVTGVEALVRWRHPKRGLLPPFEFIPTAEKTGLIDELTHWVISSALQQAKIWQDKGIILEVAVNISTRNLQDRDFVQRISELLSHAGATPGQLSFEITESAVMLDRMGAKSKLNALRQLSITFAIDDFGTGYSSLSYLRELPVSQLKIDKSFVSHMLEETGSAAIVRSTIDLAHNLSLSVIAEGVEDQATAEKLFEMGCDFGQGYFFCRPIVAQELESWLRAQQGSTN